MLSTQQKKVRRMENKDLLEERITQLEQKVASLEKKLESSSNVSEFPNSDNQKLLSEKEYLLETKPDTTVQKTLYLGNFLEKYKKMSSFTVEDLRDAFRAAREPLPSNINDAINKNMKKGLLMEVKSKDGKKAWVLTATGEKIVNDGSNKN